MTQPSSVNAATSDVVLYASDSVNLHGNWSRVSDATAAGGQTLSSTDRGWSNTGGPLASPADYFEFTFDAPSNTPFHVWLRVRASADSKYNDSLFAQFSDAVDGNGAAILGIGTSAGLTVNLATDGTGSSLSGWGWQDGAYWLTQMPTLRFSTTGSHTLRIQTREDGVQVDQIVLSAAAYLVTSPGTVTADNKIVAKPVIVSTPFTGTAIALPGTLRPENFDNGGEGLGYHDTTAGNSGAQYRNTDVDMESSTLGGYDIGWTADGEWLAYTVNVASSGTYVVQFQVASPNGAALVHANFGSINTTAVAVPNTGGWQNWTTISTTVNLSAGQQVMKAVFDVGGFNLAGVTVALIQPPPGAPSSPNPMGGATGVAANAVLTWSAAGTTSYDVSFGTTNPPPQVATALSSASFAPSGMTAGTTYFWQIVARNAGGTTAGSTWSLTTQVAPPATPTAANPSNGATGMSTSASLTWNAAGATSYDVSFGTTNPPPQVATALSSASFAPTGMTTGTT